MEYPWPEAMQGVTAEPIAVEHNQEARQVEYPWPWSTSKRLDAVSGWRGVEEPLPHCSTKPPAQGHRCSPCMSDPFSVRQVVTTGS